MSTKARKTRLPRQVATPSPRRRKSIEPLIPFSVVRRGAGKITRVLADLLVFVEVEEKKDNHVLGLVFKPDKIDGYRGESLEAIGLSVGARVREIEWDVFTLLVSRVVLERSGSATPSREAGA
jgi:hypothetical protein